MILNEFFNLPQVFEKDMTEGVMSEIDAELRNIVANEDFDALYELFSANTPAGRYVQDMYDDVVIDTGLHPDDDFERIEQIVFDRLADDFGEQDVTEKRGDLRPKLGSARDRGKSVRQWRQNRGLDEQGVEEGMFGSRPSPVLPVVDKIAKVARELTPQNVEVGKQIIQNKTNEITRMLSPQVKAGVDVIEQGMAEATGDEKFDTMMGQIQREPKYPDSQMPPTDVKDLYQWAVKNNKPYHKIFAEWANREGYKSVAPALMKAGNLDTDALDYWTPDVWKIYWAEVRGIDWEMPPEWAKKRVPDELRDYLETVFDAYDRIVFDWPTEYRQIGEQGMAEAKDDYVPPKEANYGKKYQDMVLRVGEKARAQEKAKQQQQPKAPVRESRLALLKQIIQS